VLELLPFEIAIKKKNDIEKGERKKEKGCSRVVFLIFFSRKPHLLFSLVP